VKSQRFCQALAEMAGPSEIYHHLNWNRMQLTDPIYKIGTDQIPKEVMGMDNNWFLNWL
jgi:hypothetical protein